MRTGRSEIARAILADLPAWFGIPEATEQYIAAAARLPMLACSVDGEIAGFLSLKREGRAAWEIHVMGVRRRRQRRGIGRALVQAAETYVGARGGRFLTVKTLAPAARSRAYARTRRFYRAMGFVGVETFPTLWGEGNPCLLMIKPLRRGSAPAGSRGADRGRDRGRSPRGSARCAG